MESGNTSKAYQLAIKIAGKVDSSLGSAVGNAQSTLSKLGSFAGTVAKVGAAAIAAATTAAVAFAKSAVDAGMQFDTAMSQVAATMGTTTDQIGALRDFALEMGSKTAFSATEAAEALNYMALAGYDAETSMAMLPNVLNLAAAGAIDLASASDMITDAQSALGLTLEQTSIMVDQMAAASSKSNTSVAQLGEAILTVGGTAQYMAGGTKELNTVLGVLADNGIKGSEGGTHLRNMLLKLASPTTDATKLLNSLGVQIFDAQGNMRSFTEIFPELNAAMSNLTDQERLDAMSTLFNSRDIASATALLSTTTERWEELGAAIEDSAGAAEQMANTQLDNLAGDITLFKSALEGAQIALSDQLTPTLREFVQFGSNAISTLSDAFKEGGLSGAMEALGTILSDGLNMVIAELPSMIDAGMQLLGALGQGLMDNLPMIIDAAMQVAFMFIEGLVSALPSIADAAIEIITTLANGLGDVLPELIPTTIADAAIEVFNFAVNTVGRLIGNVTAKVAEHQDTIDRLGEVISAAMEKIGGIFESYVKPAINWVVDVGIPGAIDIVASLIDNVILVGTKVWEYKDALAAAAAIYAVFKAGQGIQSIIQGFQQAKVTLSLFKASVQGANIAQAALNGTLTIGETLTALFTGQVTIAQLAQAAWATVTSVVSGAFGALNAVLMANPIVLIVMAIVGLIAGLVLLYKKCEGFRNIVNAVASAVVGFIKGAVSAIAGFFTGLWSSIQNIWYAVSGWFKSNVIDPLVSFFSPIVEWISGFFRGCWIIIQAVWILVSGWFNDNVITPVVGFFSAIPGVVGGFFSSLWEEIKAIWNVVATWFQITVIDPLVDFFAPIVETIGGFFSGLWNSICEIWQAAGNWFMENVATPINNAFQAVSDFVKGIFNGLIGFVESMLNSIVSGINSFIGGFISIVTKAASVLGISWDGVATISSVSIPRFAKGGIVDSPTILEAGEAGTEAIVPLGELWGQMQDMISDPLGSMSDRVASLAERLDALDFGNAATPISDLLRELRGEDDDNDGDGSEPQDGPVYHFTYAPQHHFHGGAPTKEDMVEAEHMSQEEFNRMMDQWVKDNERKRF